MKESIDPRVYDLQCVKDGACSAEYHKDMVFAADEAQDRTEQ